MSMTNAELLAKIKAEIERRITDNTFGAKLELIDILAWLDTLESETTYDTQQYTPRPSVGIEDVARVQFASHAKVFDKKRAAVFNWEQFKEVASIFYGFGKKDSSDTLESEKPMQEGLEEELDKWRHEHFHGKRDDHFSGEYLERTSQLDLARHFAQWQREQDEKEEADLFTIVALDAAQRAKEQMMKEAVEYEVWDFSSSLEAYPHVNIPLDNKQYRSGDKVRVIVLPKED